MRNGAQAQLRTKEEAKAWLDSRGLSVAEFAREHGLKAHTVFDIFRGKRIGRRGEAHNAAIALGMKQGVIRTVRKQGKK